MIIRQDELDSAFRGALQLNFKILRQLYQAMSIEVSPLKTSPFYLQNDDSLPLSLQLPVDSHIGRVALIEKTWDPDKIFFLKQIVGSCADNYTLIDVGANVGLFSRQVLNKLPNLKNVYAYEPHPHNFKLLTRNLKDIRKVSLNNFGLSQYSQELDFYLNSDNTGNYSLIRDAVPEECETIKVNLRSANEEKDKWITESDGLFIYKSDTEGFDEILMTAYDLDFWTSVKCGMMELYRVAKDEYDKDKFFKILDIFKNKVFANDPRRIVSSSEVASYVKGVDRGHADLFFWN